MLLYNIDKGIVAFSTKRRGCGVSEGNYGQMNINPYCGDRIENVSANLSLLADKLNILPEHIILPHQVHKTEIRLIDNGFCQLAAEQQREYLEGVDAVVTTTPNICIGVSTADCVPVLLYDKKHIIAAALHAGWRGTCEGITSKVVKYLCEYFSTEPHDIVAVIGPSISLAAFEVGDEVYEQFSSKGVPMQEIAQRVNNKWHIDLWRANQLQLTNEGIPAENIQLAGICTYANYQDYFSARRLSINSGRIYTGIMIRQ